MKKSLLLLVAGLVFAFYTGKAFGQCTPDGLVTDPEGNGEMVPDTIEAIETVPLNLTLTIIAPDTASLGSLGHLTIDHIVVRSLQNKPAWLNYACNPSDCNFPAGQSKCVLVTGTPAIGDSGYISVSVLVDVYSLILGVPVCVTCATSPNGYDSGMPLVVWVKSHLAAVTEFDYKGFGVISPQPNPFNTETKLGCYTEKAQNVSLRVTDLLGKEVYSEKLMTHSGGNFFQFTGSDLSNGVYFYSLIDSQNHVITKKMVKSN
jgi:hypothetical protein